MKISAIMYRAAMKMLDPKIIEIVEELFGVYIHAVALLVQIYPVLSLYLTLSWLSLYVLSASSLMFPKSLRIGCLLCTIHILSNLV